MAENNEEFNFLTEKIWEPLLTESLCFYWGCPNISDYIDPCAYVQLDLYNFEKSFNIIKDSIKNNLWEKRLKIIQKEKQKVLNYYNFCPTVERIILDDYSIYFENFAKQANLMNVCFIHSCTINYCTNMLDKLIERIILSGLMDYLDIIFIINIGNPLINKFLSYKKIYIINYSRKIDLYEIPTINLIYKFSTYNPNINILYLHTKGISHHANTNTNINITDWTEMMLYFLVDKYTCCIDLLNKENYDTVGCNYQSKPHNHYSGNFWWAKSNYIIKLNKIITTIRHDAEWWILSNNQVKYNCIHNSNINHYDNPYPKTNYIMN